jgi:hypothetical protein
MQFEYGYLDSSQVESTADRTHLRFSPDTKRQATFFEGQLRNGVPFREAISALHDVVVSDLRFKPKDRTEYKAWLAQQEALDWALVKGQRKNVAERIERLQAELARLHAKSSVRMKPFHDARRRYFDYLYRRERDAWFVLDPVVTVHPDQLFFECFSQDESTYGLLAAGYEVFQTVGEKAHGTTNVDYSAGLYDEFQKIRSYKTTRFEVDPSGFGVETSHSERYKEVKIDLPDSWVRGFLQVSSAMSLEATSFTLHPMDVHNFCFVLRRHRELLGPRSIRYELTPDRPVRAVFEPWNHEVVCGRSIYQGKHAAEIRVWGRRRLHLLERLIPIAKRFTVHLLGSGMPSFYVTDLGDMTFTLGLSGWTANDWSKAGNFDLMAPRAEVDELTQRRVFDALQATCFAEPSTLAAQLDLEPKLVLGALGAYTQAGRAIYDLDRRVYRVRELSREPLPMEKLRFANEREERARSFVNEGRVRCRTEGLPDSAVRLSGHVEDARHTYEPFLLIDADERLINAGCTCNFFSQNKLYQGPCEHILALRLGRGR